MTMMERPGSTGRPVKAAVNVTPAGRPRTAPMRPPESVEFPDVEVIEDAGLMLVCLVNGKRVRVPVLQALPGSEMRWTRKRGKLVIPRPLAVELGLV
jgi:hypothetical protein